tara:strand:+ start:1332 stop:2324 length:993 start_codon:yes stop_codon:yes gene_type:complete
MFLMAKVGRLSASKITTLFGCSMAYFLHYVEHVRVPSGVQLVFGKSQHYMLDRFYDVNYKSAETFSNFWKYYWFKQCVGEFLKGKEKKNTEIIEYPYNGKDDNGKKVEKKLRLGDHVKFYENPVGEFFGYMKLGTNILTRFYNRHYKEKLEDGDRKPPIEREKRYYIDLFGHPVIAILDRIDKYKGEYYLSDYKTDKNPPKTDSFVLHRHPQFTLYSKVFRQVFNATEKNILYYHLRSGEILRTKRSQKDYDYLKWLMDKSQERIEKEDFYLFYGFHCKFCDYKVACEDYSQSYGGPRIDKGNKIIPAQEFTGWHTNEEMEQWLEMSEER